ncbi:hypothetical protein [Streptomyces sp. NPDC016845]|uniref:hypothetical protein n=1 Tax=Streptomyces sp. NPDC016845 TaxID=3364972 RepID=UPI0037A14C06
MQDRSESSSIETGENDADTASATASTVIAEVLPGVAVVFGEEIPELKPDLLDFGLVSKADRMQISTVLASIGNTATVAGNLGNALASAQGIYKIGSATQALLNSGATLAIKDGANLGTVMYQGRIVAQARFIPATLVSAAQTVAMIGPALAMVALQMQLSEVTRLVRTNIALTSQVLSTIRKEQWAELTGLVATLDRAVDQAREIEAVPASLWESVASSEAILRKQLELYRNNVEDHVQQIDRADPRRRREYLQTNAEAIVFDAFALLDSQKAWTGYKALHAGKARDAGHGDAAEARLVEVIVRDTRAELDSALADTTRLVDALTRELHILAELPGHETLSLPGKRKDAKATRAIAARLLEAVEPLADALRPPVPPVEAPSVICAPEALDLKSYLRVLRWCLANGETLQAIGFPEQLEALDSIAAIIGGAKGKLAAARDKGVTTTMLAVTDRRVITARTNAFLEQGEIRQDIPLDQVRYVRAATTSNKGTRSSVDLITRDENIRWLFPPGIDNAHVDAFAGVLAESMTIPESERDALKRRRYAVEEGGEEGPSTATGPAEVTESVATTGNTV